MKFDEVLRDLAGHAIDQANDNFLAQHAGHNFAPFSVERQAFTAGGSKFKITIEFEPDPMESLMRKVAQN